MSTDSLSRYQKVWRQRAMAADLGPDNIPVDHIEELELGYTFQQNGATAPTLADVKDDFIHEWVLDLGGREICRLDHYDIFHMQNLWFGQTPHWLLPAGDDQWGYASPVTLPLSLDKQTPGGKPGELRSLNWQITVGALTDVNTLVVDSGAKYISNRNVSWLPKGFHYAYQYTTHSFATAGISYDIDFDRKGADLLFLIVFSCTVPIATSLNTSIDQLTVYVNNMPVFGPIYWEEMPTFKTTQAALDDAGLGAELEHYRILDFTKAPLPADHLSIAAQSVGAVDTGRFIGIFQEP